MLRAIWIHQFDQLSEQTPAEIAATLLPRGIGTVYVKAADGRYAMSEVYQHPLAPRSPAHLAELVTDFRRESLRLIPWVVPRRTSDEAALHLGYGQAAGGLVIDWEDHYAGFWEGTDIAARSYFDALRAANDGTLWLAVAPDARQLVRAEYDHVLISALDAMLPQCYWTDFERPWLDVLQEAHLALAPLGVPIEPILPWDGLHDDLRAAVQWCAQQSYRAVSIWRMGTADTSTLDIFGERAPGESPLADPLLLNCEGPITGLAYVADTLLDQVQADSVSLLEECRRLWPRKTTLRQVASRIQASVAEGRRVREQFLGPRPG